MKNQRWIVKKEEVDTLVHFLLQKFENVSQRQVRRALDAARCLVNGRVERFAQTKLRPGDEVVFEGQIEAYATKAKETFEVERILYEDSYFLIYNKPVGISSDRAGIVTALRAYCPHLKIVHRLDRLTSGILILAKTEEAEEKFLRYFKTQAVKKVYLALVDGVPKHSFGVIKKAISKKSSYGHGQTLYQVSDSKKSSDGHKRGQPPYKDKISDEEGKFAITKWKVRAATKEEALLQCTPLTGRTHQIRVHLSWMGHPILGDYQYGERFKSKKSKKKLDRMLLHAWKVEFKHPFTGEEVRVESPVPSEFEL